MKRYMKYKLLAFLMSFMMMVSMIPTTVFAEGLFPLEGELQIKEEAFVGTELRADYEKVTPQGFTEEQVKFLWMRTTLEAEEEAEKNQTENLTRVEIGKEPTYILTEEDVGYIVVLRITGLEEFGYTGFLEAKTETVAYADEIIEEELITEEELLEDVFFEETLIETEILGENTIPEELNSAVVEEIPAEETAAVTEEIPAEETATVTEEIPAEETAAVTEEIPAEKAVVAEDIPSEETLAVNDVIPVEETSEENVQEEILIEEVIVEEMTFNADGSVVEEVTYEMTTNLEENVIDFGTFAFGQENVSESKNVILTNIGTGDITIVLPELSQFAISKVNPESPDVLSPGNQIEYTINPKNVSVLGEGIYAEDILLGEEGKSTVKIAVSFEISAPVETTPEPTEAPAEPTEAPAEPTPEPTEALAEPTPEPTEAPAEPTPEPTEAPAEPTPEPTEAPAEPTPEPTEAPAEPTPEPTEAPAEPTPTPTETPELITAIEIQPSSHNFGVVEAGYAEAPDAQYITIVNIGDTTLNLIQPVSEYYEISALNTVVLEPNGTTSFTVRPKTGLEKGDYYETIYIETEEGVSEFAELSFTVTSKTVKLQGIEQIADITGLANGVKKTEKGLKLPSAVAISTTNGKMKANVTWDLDSCEYNRKSVKAQAFVVNGKVTLPEGIKNPDEISLNISVNVTVKGYSPKIADAANNQITGISSSNYTTQSKISFAAIGAGMDNENPRQGDVRYCPVSWGVFNTNTWKSAPYSAAFGMGQAGSYNLNVTYNRQQFDGESWINTGEQDKKTVTFHVVQAEEQVNLTPVPEKQETNQKEAVATGDTTVILPLIIAMVVALACVIAVLIYKKRK